MKCPRKNCQNKAVIDKTYGVLPCQKCQAEDMAAGPLKMGPEFVNISKADRVQHQRDYGAKDMLQPFVSNKPNPEFAQAYPELLDKYYTKEEIRKL